MWISYYLGYLSNNGCYVLLFVPFCVLLPRIDAST